MRGSVWCFSVHFSVINEIPNALTSPISRLICYLCFAQEGWCIIKRKPRQTSCWLNNIVLTQKRECRGGKTETIRGVRITDLVNLQCTASGSFPSPGCGEIILWPVILEVLSCKPQLGTLWEDKSTCKIFWKMLFLTRELMFVPKWKFVSPNSLWSLNFCKVSRYS